MATNLNERFLQRCLTQQQENQSEDGMYMEVVGDYSDVTIASDVSVKTFFNQRIGELLACPDQTEPVVMMDVGAGAALSVYELAAKHRASIEAGRLSLIAVNRLGTPRDFLGIEGRLLEEARPANIVELGRFMYAYETQERNSDLVTAYTANFSALQCFDGQSGLPDLRGGVDIIHERLSITSWSNVPELHIPRLGALISDRGIYMVSASNSYTPLGLKGWQQHADRLAAVGDAQDALCARPDLKLAYCIEAGALAGKEMDYFVFKAQEAPPISLGVPSAS